MSVRRDELQRLIDILPDERLATVHRVLVRLLEEDPLLRIANAPEDDEPLSPEDEKAIRVALEEVVRGELAPHEEAKRRFLNRE